MANLGVLKNVPSIVWIFVMAGLFMGAGLWTLTIFQNVTNQSAPNSAAVSGIGTVITALTSFATQFTFIISIAVIGIIIAVVFWAMSYAGGNKRS